MTEVQVERKFSTRFEDHEGLLHVFTKGGFARFGDFDPAVDYEDLYQEACLGFVRAQKSYDPEKGVGFSAYMGRVVVNGLYQTGKRIARQAVEVPVTSLEEMVECLEDGDSDDIACLGVEDIHAFEENQAARERMNAFDPVADKKERAIIRDMISPSEALKKAHAAARAHYEHGVSMGERGSYVAEELELRFICKYHGVTYPKFAKKVREKLGVEIRT